ncbi:hypothetical protein H0H81_000124 [Sphagnurus paluster]|uniref:Rad60/SUMO-like domain-containing protein n=1 Tax=Sphagnurus paluster TaxID=117069 RepID=A0A9P7GV42_9AGAR|nr:hypothetical protein H0H81_000124 [Sphagnurus paluster]
MKFAKIFAAAEQRFKKEPGEYFAGEMVAKMLTCRPGTFKFTYDGERVKADDTPGGLGMEDGDQIDAHLEQPARHDTSYPMYNVAVSNPRLVEFCPILDGELSYFRKPVNLVDMGWLQRRIDKFKENPTAPSITGIPVPFVLSTRLDLASLLIIVLSSPSVASLTVQNCARTNVELTPACYYTSVITDFHFSSEKTDKICFDYSKGSDNTRMSCA